MLNRRYNTITAVTLLITALFLLPNPEAAALRDIRAGQTPPPFSLRDMSGNIVGSELFLDGPSVIIFWSTWSPRSEELLEDFRGYYKEYASKGLKVAAVNVDGEKLTSSRKKEILDFANRLDLPFPVLLDEDLKTFKEYGVIAHPAALVIDADGVIAYVLDGYPRTLRGDLKDEVQKVLGLYVEPPAPETPLVSYVPKGGALQLYNMGAVMFEKGQTEKALEYFKKARERDPGYIEPVIMVARLSLALNDVESAEGIVREISSESINRSDVRYLLGYLMLIKGEHEAARKLFGEMLDKSPENGLGWWGLGMTALAQDDVKSALDRMEKARTYEEKNPEAETYARAYLKKWWMRGATPPEEDRFLELFPELSPLKEQYRMLFGTRPAVP